MNPYCPICGHSFSPLDLLLAERDPGYQCHHCWSRVQGSAPGPLPTLIRSRQKSRKRSPAARPRAKAARRAA